MATARRYLARMNVSFALFCDAANLSQEGKLNILGVFDAVQVGTVPTIHPRAHLVVRFKGRRADIGTHSVVLRWTGPEGKELWSSGNTIESWNHFSGLTVANGRAYIATFDGTLYCFGIPR